MMEVFPVPSSPITRILYRCSFFSGFPAYNNIQQRYQTGKDFLAYNIRQRYEAGKDFLAYNIRQRYQVGKDFLPTTYNKDIRHGRISCLQNTTVKFRYGRMPFLNIQQRYQAGKDIRQGRIFLPTTFNKDIKKGRIFLPTIYDKDIRQGRISCLQHTTKISGMAGYPAYKIQQYQEWYDAFPQHTTKISKDIKHCWISCLQHKTKISEMSGMTGFPANIIQQRYQT